MMRFERFTERAQDAAARAYEILQRYGHNQVDTEHILLALLEQTDGVIPQILEKLTVDVDAMRSRLDEVLRASPKAAIYGHGANQVFITPRVKRIIDLANEEANRLRDEYISTEHIFLAILNERNTAVAKIMADNGITRDRVYDAIKDVRGGQRVTDPQAESRYRTLEKYSRDLTRMALEGKLDPVDRARRRDHARDSGALPPHQEQPGADRRSRRRQDRDCRGLGAEDRRRRRAGNSARQESHQPRPERDAGGQPLSR